MCVFFTQQRSGDYVAMVTTSFLFQSQDRLHNKSRWTQQMWVNGGAPENERVIICVTFPLLPIDAGAEQHLKLQLLKCHLIH